MPLRLLGDNNDGRKHGTRRKHDRRPCCVLRGGLGGVGVWLRRELRVLAELAAVG